MYDVITMGSSTVDAFANTEREELIDIKTKDGVEELIAFPLGAKIPIKELRYNVGGDGVNVGVGLSRLGLKTAYLGKIGNDSNGKMIMDCLQREGLTFIGAVGKESGFSIILDSELGHDRTILGFKGCNNTLKIDEIDHSKIQAKLLYLAAMLGDSLETMKKVVKIAKGESMKIAFNPSQTLAQHGIENIHEIIEKTDILILNGKEAELLVGVGTADEKIHRLWDLGPDIVLLTLGGAGIIVRDEKHLYRMKPHACREVKETTGAGDACSSGFLAGIIYGKDIPTSMRMGMLNAEAVLCHYGAQNNLLTKSALENSLASDERSFSKEPL